MATQSFSVYKSKQFARFARRARLSDDDLWQAAQRANDGLIDADLGGGVIKQRIARKGEGKSGGTRTILLFRRFDRTVFVYGFEKKDQANISEADLNVYRRLANIVLGHSPEEMDQDLRGGTFIEIRPGERGNDEKKV